MSSVNENCCSALGGNYNEQDGICYDIPVSFGADGSTIFGVGDSTAMVADVDNPCTYITNNVEQGGSGSSFWQNLGNIFTGAGQAVSSGAVNSAYCNLYSLFNSNVPPQCRPQGGLNGQDGQDGQDAEFNFKKLIVPIFILLIVGLILFLIFKKKK